MRCPNCGSQATVYGSRWECGWCGDFGTITRQSESALQTTSIEFTVTGVEFRVDLLEEWRDLQKAFQLCVPDEEYDQLQPLLESVFLQQIVCGIRYAKVIPREKSNELKRFLLSNQGFQRNYTEKEILRIALSNGSPFAVVGELSAEECGVFWKRLILIALQNDMGDLRDFFWSLGQVYFYFAEDYDVEDDRRFALEEWFIQHYDKYEEDLESLKAECEEWAEDDVDRAYYESTIIEEEISKLKQETDTELHAIEESWKAIKDTSGERPDDAHVTAAHISNTTSSLSRIFPILFVLLLVAVVAGFCIHNYRLETKYTSAVELAQNGDYSTAYKLFEELKTYQDSEALATYCKYAALYVDASTYQGGEMALQRLADEDHGSFNEETRSLSQKVTRLAEEERRQEAAKLHAEMIDKYAGKIPEDRMPFEYLKYTAIGLPNSTELCQFYDNMDIYRRYKVHRWYNEEGQIVAFCHSQIRKEDGVEEIYAFDYNEIPIGRPNSAPPLQPPFGTSDGSDRYDVEDYNNVEDFYIDHWMDFDGLDDAQMYFDNHKK